MATEDPNTADIQVKPRLRITNLTNQPISIFVEKSGLLQVQGKSTLVADEAKVSGDFLESLKRQGVIKVQRFLAEVS